ncbi:MAG: U32 family peptidase [Clostridia bacterium]|nr:U32 family peptidase [Clostridia bacterium]
MINEKKPPELLSPAGNFEKMKAAILYGADAVYLAGDDFGMRAAADNFALEELFAAAEYAHARGVRINLTLNTMPHNDEYPKLIEFVKSIRTAGIDAVIAADIGVMALVREYLPEAELHVSTQMSTVSAPACRQWHMLGAKRIVLARELTLAEIRSIRADLPEEIELEAFIHGSMCVSYSGRCLLSQHFVGRDANRGRCAQPCRWNMTYAPTTYAEPNLANDEGVAQYEIIEEKRPENRLPVIEDERGTFFLSSKDMCMIEHIPELMEAGIDSFKIEGRMKSEYYAAVVTNTYRMAIDRYLADPAHYEYDPAWLRELESVSHREYNTGYYFAKPMEDANSAKQPGYMKENAYLCRVTAYDEATGIATFIQRNKAYAHSEAEIITPGSVGRTIRFDAMFNEAGEEIESTPHPYMIFTSKVPFPVKPGDIVRAK